MIYFKKIFSELRFVLWNITNRLLSFFVKGQSVFSLVPFKEFKNKYAKKSIIEREKEKIWIRSPRIINENENENENIVLDFPEISISYFENIIVSGRTPFYFKNRIAAFPDLVDIETDLFKVEIFRVGKINAKDSTMMYYDVDRTQQERCIESAISLLGECTGNYAHFLIETLPKLLLIDKYAEFESFPLLVDDWIHPNFIESIRLLGKYDREIIIVKPWESYFVKNLASVSPPAYIAPDHRDRKKASEKKHCLFTFSKYAFSLLRDASAKVEIPSRIQHLIREKSLKKLYLPRTAESAGNKSRQIINNQELDEFMREMKFDFISPTDFTFQEQIAIFREAEIVVSPAGAALINLFFTKPGCRVVSLSPRYKNKLYDTNRHFFNNFMNIMGHELYFVLGEQEGKGDFTHRKYHADLNALSKILSSFLL